MYGRDWSTRKNLCPAGRGSAFCSESTSEDPPSPGVDMRSLTSAILVSPSQPLVEELLLVVDVLFHEFDCPFQSNLDKIEQKDG